MPEQSGVNQPLVSIVIPAYNSEKFVAEAIESALGQTYPNIEVIVVDDGSTDGTLNVIRSFGDRVSCLSGANAGAAAARNKGAAVARGELLQFLDADDILYPDKLHGQVPLAIQHRPGLVLCDADVVELQTNESRGRWGTGSMHHDDAVVYALRAVIQTSAPLHWRESFDLVGGFRSDTPPSDDRDLHLRLACHGVPFIHTPQVLYRLRRVDGSLTKRNPSRGVETDRRICEDAYQYILKNGTLDKDRKAAFAAFFVSTARRAFRMGLHECGDACLHRARQIHPDSGFEYAYAKGTRTIARLLGPRLTEQLVVWKRKLFRNQEIA